ncbi:MAG: PstS family phosphate ABC transporter substrate-binding protein [Phycisphaerales bacterium]
MKRWIGSMAALVVGGGLAIAGGAQVDQSLPTYTPTQGVSGNLKSVGSDTMNNLMTFWGEQFNKFYPGAKIEIEGKGSSTAPPALIENQAQFGPMSREMKAAEVDAFEKKFGYKPTALRTGIDALAVYVHKDNPIKSLTMDQLKQIFSVTGPEKMTWGDLGLTGEWASRPVSLYGRNSASGTYGYFKEHALSKADYKPTVKEQPGSSAVVQGVATDKSAIGYSGLGYKTADVKAVPINGVPAENETALSGEYPLARFLYMYINHKPGTQLDPLRREFVRLVFSQQGQEVVVKDGYIPVPYAVASEELTKLGISTK